MDFWLTILTGIWIQSCVCVWRSLVTCGDACSLTLGIPMDWVLLDKEMKKTPVDSQKSFPKNHAGPKYQAACRCYMVEITPVDWERVTVHCELLQHLQKSLESFIQLTSFCNSLILAVISFVSWIFFSKMHDSQLLNSLQFFHWRLLMWASRRSRLCSESCSWSSWSRRSCSSLAKVWSISEHVFNQNRLEIRADGSQLWLQQKFALFVFEGESWFFRFPFSDLIFVLDTNFVRIRVCQYLCAEQDWAGNKLSSWEVISISQVRLFL